MRRWIAGLCALLLLSSGAALAFAPYLPRLIWEGSPSLTSSDRGVFAEVTGAEHALNLRERLSPALDPDLQKLFNNSQGAALLLAQDGELRLEHYAEGHGPETRFNSFSMVKSLVGALLFKAIAEGKLTSLDQTLGELLPTSPGLRTLTLQRLITMRAGIHFDSRTNSFATPGSVKDTDTFPNPFGPLARLHFEGLDAIEAGLSMDDTSPEALDYQNVSTALLGKVLETAYGQPLEELLSDRIWKPAGAMTAVWRKPHPAASVSAYCCLYAKARDWIRVGLYLEANGTKDAPFLPDSLWREFLGLDVSRSDRAIGHYGNHTLQNVLDRPGQSLQGPFTYFIGQYGQLLYLMPDKDLVVYRAGNSVQVLHSTLYGAWNSLQAADAPSKEMK